MRNENRTRGKRCRRWAVSLSAGWLLAACGADAGGGTGGGGAGGTPGEQVDAEISLNDVGTGGSVTPTPDAAAGGQPLPGGTVADAGPGADVGAGDDAATAVDAARVRPDAAVVTTCGGHDIVDLNAALADAEAYDGTTAGVEGTLAASCGGAAGGEVVFRYRVDRPLNRLTFRTDFPETQAATVLYVRTDCEEPVDLACNRGAPGAPGTRASVDGVSPGVYYVVVDTGAREGGGAFRLAVEEDGASACRDLDDNDADGRTDLDDPGCEAPEDDTEQDPPVAPACADGVDNDGNGFTDYPADEQCSAAGDDREGPVCALDVPSTDVGIEGGRFSTDLPFVGADLAQGRCTFEAMPEHLFIVTLDRAARVQVVNNSLREFGTPVAFYARAACDDANTELGCSDPFNGSLNLGELAAGTYFIFAEPSQQGGFDGGPVPFGAGVTADIEFVIRPAHPVCSDEVDNDRDGAVDLADPGCRDARDEDETDPANVPFCANGQDDDGDGTVDFPGDEGCTGAGDACEEVGFDFCEGRCQDVVSNAAHCGRCGNACADGVECIEGYCGGLYVFEGYQRQVPLADLGGWQPCFVETYDQSSSLQDMIGACDGEMVLVGCKAAGSDVLELAAMGQTAEVFRDTGDNNNDTNEHNGVGWYFSENTSVGFVPAGATPLRQSCDTDALPDWNSPDDGTGEGRMCWHTSGGATQGGFRCGMTVSFDAAWERVVYTTARAAVPTACADGLDNDGDGLADADDLGCESPLDSEEADAPDAPAPACMNMADDDEDGAIDFPGDPDCLAAGDPTEAPRCGLGVPVTEIGQAGGQVRLPVVDGDDATRGTCGDGLGRAQVIALTLTDPSNLAVDVLSDGEPSRAVVYVRTSCDDPASEVTCRQAADGHLALRNLDRGTYYVFIERTGRRVERLANVTVESNIRQCNDLVDNDGDERIDAADPGCRQPFDANEGDDPEVPAECSDGVDNDEDMLTDWPDDVDCVAAGDSYERALCQAPYEVVELPAETGVYAVAYNGEELGPNRGSCGDGLGGEAVFLLHLDDPSRVEVGTYSGPVFGNFLFGTTYVRSACDDAETEVGCGGDQFDGRPVSLARLEPGDYFIFSEFSPGWEFGDPNIQPELHLTVTSLLQRCENRRDDDGDGLVDALDFGCEGPSDNDEQDVEGVILLCANGQDDDQDGAADYPADDGCAAVGDPCEEVGYLQCGGVCLDGQVDPANCGACGNACDAGVECIGGWCGGAVPILPNDAFGHHGSCDSWNLCNNAQGCADAACRMQGFARAVDYDEGSCQGLPAQGIRCNLFFGLDNNLDYEADYHGCELPVAYNIVCAPN